MEIKKPAAQMIEKPYLALAPFLLFFGAGMYYKVGLLHTAAFAYQGVWCMFRHRVCGTVVCSVTGPLYLLIALFSLLGWIPAFNTSALSWSNWDNLMLVFWIGTTAGFAAMWRATREMSHLVWTISFLVASLVVYWSY